MPPTKSERRLHDTIRRLRSELATANATVAYLRKRLRDVPIEVDAEPRGDVMTELKALANAYPVAIARRSASPRTPTNSIADLAMSAIVLGRRLTQDVAMVVSAHPRDPSGCDDDPGAHEPYCGQCALCPGFGDCDDEK